jgi:hypothetical protein
MHVELPQPQKLLTVTCRPAKDARRGGSIMLKLSLRRRMLFHARARTEVVDAQGELGATRVGAADRATSPPRRPPTGPSRALDLSAQILPPRGTQTAEPTLPSCRSHATACWPCLLRPAAAAHPPLLRQKKNEGNVFKRGQDAACRRPGGNSAGQRSPCQYG